MSDDHAAQAVGCYGSRINHTPHIDRLAREGLRVDNAFCTNSICAPSRAAILTGKYSHLNDLRDNRDEFDSGQPTFPKLLQAAGYQTAVVGKWHLKSIPTGFDIWRILSGQGSYYNPQFTENGEIKQYTGYTTDIITEKALDVLERRDRQKPLCLLVHHKAPHRNFMPALRHLDALKDQQVPLPETFFDDYATRSPAAGQADMRVQDMFLSFDLKLQPSDYAYESGTGGQAGFNAEEVWSNTLGRLTEEQGQAWAAHYDPVRAAFRENRPAGRALQEWKYQRYIKDYLRCVMAIDEGMGRLLDYLDTHGLTENTIVIYTSDQGFFLGEHGWYDKRFMYEESLRIPLLIRYPREIPPGLAAHHMVLNLDFAPTFLDYAGADALPEMQGRSFRPITKGKIPGDWRTSMYYHYYEYPHGWHNVMRHVGVRTERFKLIHFYHDIDAWELYDLEQDPHELNNLYGITAYSRKANELKAELDRLRRLYGDSDTSTFPITR
jgi:arylsulfatase A-like enzyme